MVCSQRFLAVFLSAGYNLVLKHKPFLLPWVRKVVEEARKRQALQMSSLNLCISFISGAKIVNIVESTIIYQLIKYCTAILFRGYYL